MRRHKTLEIVHVVTSRLKEWTFSNNVIYCWQLRKLKFSKAGILFRYEDKEDKCNTLLLMLCNAEISNAKRHFRSAHKDGLNLAAEVTLTTFGVSASENKSYYSLGRQALKSDLAMQRTNLVYSENWFDCLLSRAARRVRCSARLLCRRPPPLSRIKSFPQTRLSERVSEGKPQ